MPVEPSTGSVGASSVGTPEVVSIIETRPMVVGPLREATRTVTSSVAAEASEEDEESLVEVVSVDCVWLVPQAASTRPAVMEPNAASAWRRVMLVSLSMVSPHMLSASQKRLSSVVGHVRATGNGSLSSGRSGPRVRRGNSSMHPSARAAPAGAASPAAATGSTTKE